MAKRKAKVEILTPENTAGGITVKTLGGGMEGAGRTSRELALWSADRKSSNQLINFAKEEADYRGREMVTNDGATQGLIDLYRNHIVGTQYRLNAQPNYNVLSRNLDKSFDEVWAGEYQEYVEEKFNMIGESEDCWLDAGRRLTFTGSIRMAIAGWGFTGEDLATAEWKRETDRPFYTCVQQVSPMRLSNPNNTEDKETLHRGIATDSSGKPIGYWIRLRDPGEFYSDHQWKFVEWQKPWGRKMVLHTIDPVIPGTMRAVSEIVAVLKDMRMAKKFKEIVLQNAVINASYAATVESDLPTDVIAAMLGGGGAQQLDNPAAGMLDYCRSYLTALQTYLTSANGVAIDGAKIPHLFPGTKLNAKNLGTPGGVGTEFEVSLHRFIAASLGVSYEEYSNDYSRTNYSSGQMAGEKTRRHMMAKKKFIADRRANWTYTLWLEEDFADGGPPLPVGWGAEAFYESYAKEALTACDWIGSGRGQIDELKETQAAMLRIKSRLSTWEVELSRLGMDWRKIFRQIKRESEFATELGLAPVDMNAQQNNQGVDTQGTLNSDAQASLVQEFIAAIQQGWKPKQ